MSPIFGHYCGGGYCNTTTLATVFLIFQFNADGAGVKRVKREVTNQTLYFRVTINEPLTSSANTYLPI